MINVCPGSVKYIALLALVYIVPTHPHLIEDYQDVILASVDDPDLSIRLRTLELLKAMVRPTSTRPA
jgi:AP-3 complex subunit delta-1